MSWLSKHVGSVAASLASLVRSHAASDALGRFASLLTALETVVAAAESLVGSPSNGQDSVNARSVPGAPAAASPRTAQPQSGGNPSDGRSRQENASEIFADGEPPPRA